MVGNCRSLPSAFVGRPWTVTRRCSLGSLRDRACKAKLWQVRMANPGKTTITWTVLPSIGKGAGT
jgi:hypothetical protein